MVVLLTVIVLLCGCGSIPEKHAQDVQKLEEQVFPLFEVHQVQSWRSQRWCSLLQYKGGAYTTNLDQNCILDYLYGALQPFDDSAQTVFDSIDEAVDRTGTGVYIIDAEYVKETLCYAVFDFGVQTYVYDPGYSFLPEDIPNQLGHIAINSDWYYIWEDWN